MRPLTPTILTLSALAALLMASVPAHAGCGCDKPPPPPSQILPHVTYEGTPVRLLNPIFADGQTYSVTFTSGVNGEAVTVQGEVAVRRDLADTVAKPQLVVTLPSLPLGPASLAIRNPSTGALVSAIDDSQFTVAPTPVALPTTYGTFTYPGFQAAVGRDGVAYVSFDLTGLQDPMIFEAQARKYALRFGGDDVIFYNIQGFVMQLLQKGPEPVPGMFVFPADAASADSDLLHYSRHEFSTYFLQHAERQPHAVDATDPNWHLDGTRHVDHDHLILAIAGTLNGTLPAAGATPAFDLTLAAHSLFHEGLVGVSSVKIDSGAVVDSYEPGVFETGSSGDVFSTGTVTVASSATVRGSITGAKLAIAADALVTGTTYLLQSKPTFMSVKVPSGITDLGDLTLAGGVRTIQGPGSFVASRLDLENWSLLVIDNSDGPVTMYVTGPVTLDALSAVSVMNPDPEQFAIYVAGTDPVTLSGNFGSAFYGVLYAPRSTVTLDKGASFFGAFIGNSVTSKGQIHYDSHLRSRGMTTDASLTTQAAPAPMATATAAPKATATAKPTATATATAQPTATATATPKATATPTPTSTPVPAGKTSKSRSDSKRFSAR